MHQHRSSALSRPSLRPFLCQAKVSSRALIRRRYHPQSQTPSPPEHSAPKAIEPAISKVTNLKPLNFEVASSEASNTHTPRNTPVDRLTKAYPSGSPGFDASENSSFRKHWSAVEHHKSVPLPNLRRWRICGRSLGDQPRAPDGSWKRKQPEEATRGSNQRKQPQQATAGRRIVEEGASLIGGSATSCLE